jgi:hypothetical protein
MWLLVFDAPPTSRRLCPAPPDRKQYSISRSGRFRLISVKALGLRVRILVFVGDLQRLNK